MSTGVKPLVPYPVWRVAGTAVVPNGVTMPGFRSPQPVLIGRRARVWGPVRGADVTLAAEAVVLGSIQSGGDVVLGARSQVAGTLRAHGNVLVQRGAKVQGQVRALGDIVLCDGADVGEVHAKRDVRVHGRVFTARLKAGGRTVMLDA